MAYTYTASGQIETVTDHRGTTRYEYDSEARLARRIDPDGTEISYGYDTLGRKTSVTVPSGTTTYTYDAYGRLDTVTDPDGVSVTHYTYDTHGNKESVSYPNGIITEYGYDNLNRLISVETRTLMSDIMASYVYTLNAKGQRTTVEERIGGQIQPLRARSSRRFSHG